MAKNRLWKRLGLGAVALISTAVLVACGNSSSDSENEINWYLPALINTLDPSTNTDRYSATAIGNSQSNLMRIDGEGKLQPDLAEKVEASEDGLTWTATLRDGLKWSDGSELTAEDFVYSWQRILNPETGSEYAFLAVDAMIENAKEINEGTEKDLSKLGVKADGNKVIFTLTQPSPYFEYLLSFSNFMPQKQEYVEEVGKDYATTSENQIYSGPYTVEGWNGTNEEFRLVKNENYWDAENVTNDAVNVRTITEAATVVDSYFEGEVDNDNISLTTAIYNEYKDDEDVQILPEATTQYLEYMQNGDNKALSNKKIRQALNLATDREGLTNAAKPGSIPATGLVPTNLAITEDGQDLAEYVAPGYEYNEEEAKKLFAEGLKEIGEDKITLTITGDDDEAAKNTMNFLKESWESTLDGLTIEIKSVQYKQRLELGKTQNFDIILYRWGGDYPEGSTFYGLFTTSGSFNNGKFSNEAYDKAYNDAITTNVLDRKKAEENYKQAEKALMDEANINPLFFRTDRGHINQDIEGLVLNATGLFEDFTYAHK